MGNLLDGKGLNLKPLNEFVSYHHFKMDTIQTALKLMRPGSFMTSVDLKDAYYSVPVAKEDRKYLKLVVTMNTRAYPMALLVPLDCSQKS